MDFIIEKGIPYPINKKSIVRDFPFDEFNVGDSIKIPIENANLVRQSAYWWVNKMKNEWKFSVLKFKDEGYARIWRIK